MRMVQKSEDIVPTYFSNISAALVTIWTSIVFMLGLFAIVMNDPLKTSEKKPDEPNVFVCQSVCISLESNRKKAKLVTSYCDDVRTMYDAYMSGMQTALEAGDCRFIGKRNGNSYEWLTYDEVLNIARKITAYIDMLGYTIGQKTKIGILSVNSVEWMQVLVACFMHRMIVVPINHYLDDADIVHIINECELELVFVNNVKNVNRLLSLKTESNTLNHIVVFSSDLSMLKQDRLCDNALRIIKWCEIVNWQTMFKSTEATLPRPDDIMNICYTSGSSGLPKGAIITHSNLIGSISGLFFLCNEVIIPGKEVLLSYLPLFHVFEFVSECMFMAFGFKIGYLENDPKNMINDAAILKPTYLPLVPRTLNSIYDRFQCRLLSAGYAKRFVFKWAIRWKQHWINSRLSSAEKPLVSLKHPFYDVPFKFLQDSLGGEVKYMMIGGSSPIAEVASLMTVVLGAYIIEGYGQTETCSGSICQRIGDMSTGNVGIPTRTVKLKVVPIQASQKRIENEQNSSECESIVLGEACFKGASVFKGYYGRPMKEGFDEDGWFHSGDVVRRNPNGSFSIVDRVKDIFKLSHGEYIAPAKIEDIYSQSKYINQCLIHGNSQQNYCVALITINEQEIKEDCKIHIENIDQFSIYDLCINKVVERLILADMDRIAANARIRTIEKVKKIHLIPEEFSLINGFMTATMKVKRFAIMDKYKQQIDQLYASMH